MGAKINKGNIQLLYGLIIVLFIITIFQAFAFLNDSKDEGSYDYCVEWLGFSDGTLNRDNLLYTCFSLSEQKFICDYDINRETQILMIKPILDIDYDEKGEITEIEYGNPNYFNCTRWLKSKRR